MLYRGNPEKDGENNLQSHICAVTEYIYEDGFSGIQGYCVRSLSIRKDPYKISFLIDKDRNVVKTDKSCSCIGGRNALCKHACALFTWINSEKTLSKTDRPCEWNQPSAYAQSLYREPKTAVELWGGESMDHDFRPNEEKLQRQKERMQKFGLEVSFLKL